jgi:hypothetical protein|tara:strand:+ start:310 stop:414 length:105 start_codon:yes stop_codon:yes gene_type:complete
MESLSRQQRYRVLGLDISGETVTKLQAVARKPED